MRCLTEDRAEAPDEVRLRDVGDRGNGAHIERLGVGTIHRIAGAEESPIEVLDFATHSAPLRDLTDAHAEPPPAGEGLAGLDQRLEPGKYEGHSARDWWSFVFGGSSGAVGLADTPKWSRSAIGPAAAHGEHAGPC